MGVITPSNTTEFKPSKYLFSKVRRFLSSYDAASLLDEGEFPTYVKEVLKSLPASYKESQALIKIENGSGKLPDDFEYLYSAYKCSPMDNYPKTPTKHLQNSSFGFTTEIKSEINENNGCSISVCDKPTTQTITVENYVIEQRPINLEFGNLRPLRLSPNLIRDVCVDEGQRFFLNSSAYEISIDNGRIYANFDDHVYMKYYAFPIDEDGDILIPGIEQLEKTIEWYIIYQILLSTWFNSSVPDIQNKWQKAEMEYEKYRAEYKYLSKLQSFSEAVNSIRNARGGNNLVFFSKQMGNTHFQSSR